MTKLCLILGDQLSHNLSSLNAIDKDEDVILMCEVYDEATYVKHHKKKIAFLFSAMRHHAEDLRGKGYTVLYTKLDDQNNTGSFRGEVERAIKDHDIEQVIVTEPGEYRVLQDMRDWGEEFEVSVTIMDDDRFMASHDFFEKWAKDRKELRMEYFYREMRKKYDILMDGDKPEGGEWNYDSQNRKKLPDDMTPPDTYRQDPDDITQEVMDLVADRFADHFGDLQPFHFAVTRRQALAALRQFFEERFENFGDYQDAMKEDEPWMYHSHISFYLNCGLLDPKEVVERAEEAYRDGSAPLNAVEGFIRQIIGWREFIRGVYWLKMPDYAQANALDAKRDLPEFYWTGETKMNCLKQCVKETKENAYAHHIQRLMVLGNFALLAGIDPRFVNEWYLIVYADAYEWVEMPNVTGMILYADDGVFASKPYAAGGSYINRMSDYCKNCEYSVTKKTGEGACPFNYLYWDFLIRNQDRLEGNPRLNMMYSNVKKMDADKKKDIQDSAQKFLEDLS